HHLRALPLAERRGRFVEQDDLRRQGARRAQPLASQLLCHPRQAARRMNLVVAEQARAQVECGIGTQRLMHGVDTCEAGVVRPTKPDGCTFETDDPGVGQLDTGKTFDQRRLAGAVVADHRQHLTRVDCKVDVVERGHEPVPPREAGCLERRGARPNPVGHACTPPLTSRGWGVFSSAAFSSAPPSATHACRLSHVNNPITDANVPYTGEALAMARPTIATPNSCSPAKMTPPTIAPGMTLRHDGHAVRSHR